MSLLRASARGAAFLAGRQAAPPARVVKVIPASQESAADKFYRWLDVTGFVSRYYNRKLWVLDRDPRNRVACHMFTEVERKWDWFKNAMVWFMAPWPAYACFYMMSHCFSKPPAPTSSIAYFFPVTMDKWGENYDQTYWSPSRMSGWWTCWGGKMRHCKQCPLLDFQCKRECIDDLRQKGYWMWSYGPQLNAPRNPEYKDAPKGLHYHGPGGHGHH
mmetsp:Transcript_6285/g.12435  ORF Transcript_6285/g.12435 Transcript_6285/m.12435 type:complete len:216 (-) Transcript_6285:833-1480(-)